MINAIKLAPLYAENAETVASLHARCFDRAWSFKDFRRFAGAGGHCSLVALRENELAGFIVVRIADCEADILTLGVDPNQRRHGIASAFLNQILDELALRGVRSLFLEVGIDNHAACKLYERIGFRPVGERTAYYHTKEGRQDALIMRLDLQATKA